MIKNERDLLGFSRILGLPSTDFAYVPRCPRHHTGPDTGLRDPSPMGDPRRVIVPSTF